MKPPAFNDSAATPAQKGGMSMPMLGSAK